MKPIGLTPILLGVKATGNGMKSQSVRFQASLEPDGPEAQAVMRRVDTLLTAIQEGKARAVSANPGQYQVTVSIDGKNFVLSGYNAPRYGTMPVQYSLQAQDNGETLRYTGPGCFSPENACYKETFSSPEPEVIYGPAAEKAIELFSRLFTLADSLV
jgi:hypothetical protein